MYIFTRTDKFQGLKEQEALLESFILKKPTSSSNDHQRYLHTKLIALMEGEMDMQHRTTRRELSDMSYKELESHLAKTAAMHKLTLDLQQRGAGMASWI
jgi:hypothetical protein